MVFHIARRAAAFIDGNRDGLSVDVEYNRINLRDAQGPAAKRLYYRTKSDEGRVVLPDMIVHVRGSGHDGNLLVAEVKRQPTLSERYFYYDKLAAFQDEMSYRYAVYIELGTGRQAPRWRWFLTPNDYDTQQAPEPMESTDLVSKVGFPMAMDLSPWRSNYPTWRLRPGVYLNHNKRWAEVKQDDGQWLLLRLHDDGRRDSHGSYPNSEAALKEAERVEENGAY